MAHDYRAYLFNFSASYFGGGLKRILAYLKWFNAQGGACFILNHRLKGIEHNFPANRYHFLCQNSIEKAMNYSSSLNRFITEFGNIDLYYSYGIPLPYRPGRVNWFHLANVLTLMNARKYVHFKRSLELRLLGFLIKRSIRRADVISAESESSLAHFEHSLKNKLVLSVNGSDDEITAYRNKTSKVENRAVAVGTCQYKCIDDVYKIYLNLRKYSPELSLVIVGIKEDIPDSIKEDNLVVMPEVLSQPQVCELLKSAKYYITSTLIENSYNAASEGAFLAQESFVSDIGPHRELLKGTRFKVMNNLGTRVASLQVRREDLNVLHLKTWDQVIVEVINVVQAYRST